MVQKKLKRTKSQITDKVEIMLLDGVMNYAYLSQPDDDGVYRVKITGATISDAAAAALQDFADNVKRVWQLDDIEMAGEWDLFHNMCFEVNAKSQFAPAIKIAKSADTDELYSGCIAHTVLTAYAYEYMGQFGIAFFINAVCKVAEGERLSGKTADDYFKDVLDAPDKAANVLKK